MRITTFIALTAVVLMACGGVQTEPASAPEPAVPESVVAPEPIVEPEPEPDPYADLIWYVYWQGIHCLTVYPTPGLVRSEEPDNAGPTYRTRNAHFSIISVYYEHEDAWAAAIDAATGLDDLLDRFRAMEDVEVEEALNPVQLETY